MERRHPTLTRKCPFSGFSLLAFCLLLFCLTLFSPSCDAKRRTYAHKNAWTFLKPADPRGFKVLSANPATGQAGLVFKALAEQSPHKVPVAVKMVNVPNPVMNYLNSQKEGKFMPESFAFSEPGLQIQISNAAADLQHAAWEDVLFHEARTTLVTEFEILMHLCPDASQRCFKEMGVVQPLAVLIAPDCAHYDPMNLEVVTDLEAYKKQELLRTPPSSGQVSHASSPRPSFSAKQPAYVQMEAMLTLHDRIALIPQQRAAEELQASQRGPGKSKHEDDVEGSAKRPRQKPTVEKNLVLRYDPLGSEEEEEEVLKMLQKRQEEEETVRIFRDELPRRVADDGDDDDDDEEEIPISGEDDNGRCYRDKTDFPGGDLTSALGVTTPEGCNALCVYLPRCVAWSYKRYDRVCTLKGSVTAEAPCEHCVSGLKGATTPCAEAVDDELPFNDHASCSRYAAHTGRTAFANLRGIVFEYCHGGSLAEFLKYNVAPVTTEDALSIVKTVATRLSFVHSKRVAWRDLKPDNLLLCGLRGNVLKLHDFGVSAAFAPGSNDAIIGIWHPLTFVGTLPYAAPELILHSPFDSYDMFSLGLVLKELLTGSPPPARTGDDAQFKNEGALLAVVKTRLQSCLKGHTVPEREDEPVFGWLRYLYLGLLRCTGFNSELKDPVVSHCDPEDAHGVSFRGRPYYSDTNARKFVITPTACRLGAFVVALSISKMQRCTMLFQEKMSGHKLSKFEVSPVRVHLDLKWKLRSLLSSGRSPGVFSFNPLLQTLEFSAPDDFRPFPLSGATLKAGTTVISSAFGPPHLEHCLHLLGRNSRDEKICASAADLNVFYAALHQLLACLPPPVPREAELARVEPAELGDATAYHWTRR